MHRKSTYPKAALYNLQGVGHHGCDCLGNGPDDKVQQPTQLLRKQNNHQHGPCSCSFGSTRQTKTSHLKWRWKAQHKTIPMKRNQKDEKTSPKFCGTCTANYLQQLLICWLSSGTDRCLWHQYSELTTCGTSTAN